MLVTFKQHRMNHFLYERTNERTNVCQQKSFETKMPSSYSCSSDYDDDVDVGKKMFKKRIVGCALYRATTQTAISGLHRRWRQRSCLRTNHRKYRADRFHGARKKYAHSK